jgi:hypothetical protein
LEPNQKQAGIYGGYGFNTVKSWVFENDGTDWVERKPNPPIDSTPPKGGNIVSTNADGTKLYLFSGQGNYSGDELTGTCTLGSPWATSGGMYCWLRDLWEFDLTLTSFKTSYQSITNRSNTKARLFIITINRGSIYLAVTSQPVIMQPIKILAIPIKHFISAGV